MTGWHERRRERRSQPRPRRQSPRLTKRLLHQSLSGSGRKWVNEVWQAATRASGEMSRLSPVTTPLGNHLVESYAAEHRLAGEEIESALRIAVVAGYASREVLVEPTEQPSLDASAFELRGQPDVEALATDVTGLVEPVRSIASDRFDTVMVLPSEVWNAYVLTATMRLQSQLGSKTLSWQSLPPDRIEQMLRYGYVLRCLDEAIDAEPELRTVE